VHWSVDGWTTNNDLQTADSRLGIHFVDLPTNQLPVGRRIDFTFLWADGRWEGTNFTVGVE